MSARGTLVLTAVVVWAAGCAGVPEIPPKDPPAPDLTRVAWKTTDSGLKVFDLVEGSGPAPRLGQLCVVHYVGWLEDGRRFDSSLARGIPYEFPLGKGKVIQGWDEGVGSMRAGGRRRLVVPPHLAYGAEGVPGLIPPSTSLVFEVELIQIR